MALSFRGRPKISTIPDLIREGEQSEGPWKCKECSRNFPRKKSLMAHERIHTGKVCLIISFKKCIRYTPAWKTKSVKDYLYM